MPVSGRRCSPLARRVGPIPNPPPRPPREHTPGPVPAGDQCASPQLRPPISASLIVGDVPSPAPVSLPERLTFTERAAEMHARWGGPTIAVRTDADTAPAALAEAAARNVAEAPENIDTGLTLREQFVARLDAIGLDVLADRTRYAEIVTALAEQGISTDDIAAMIGDTPATIDQSLSLSSRLARLDAQIARL